MSNYDGCFIRLVNSPELWAVDNGKRRKVTSPEHMYEIGLRPQRIVLEDEFDAIPIASAKAKKK